MLNLSLLNLFEIALDDRYILYLISIDNFRIILLLMSTNCLFVFIFSKLTFIILSEFI